MEYKIIEIKLEKNLSNRTKLKFQWGLNMYNMTALLHLRLLSISL